MNRVEKLGEGVIGIVKSFKMNGLDSIKFAFRGHFRKLKVYFIAILRSRAEVSVTMRNYSLDSR